jgi:hypothetical protein
VKAFRVFPAIILGSVLGFAAAHMLFLRWWTIIPWGLGGIALGLYCNSIADSFMAGSAYGFVLVFVFMIAQYTGDISVIRRLPFFALLAIVGAFCGLIPALTGYWIRRATHR